MKDEFNELVAYLAKEKAPKGVRNAFKRIYDACRERVIANLVVILQAFIRANLPSRNVVLVDNGGAVVRHKIFS